MALPEIRPEDRTPLVEALLGMIRQVLDRIAPTRSDDQQLRDEIAKLRPEAPSPDQAQPVGSDQAKTEEQLGGKRPGSAKRPKTANFTFTGRCRCMLRAYRWGPRSGVRTVRGPGTHHQNENTRYCGRVDDCPRRLGVGVVFPRASCGRGRPPLGRT